MVPRQMINPNLLNGHKESITLMAIWYHVAVISINYDISIPLHEVEALARILLPQIQTFFGSEEGQKEFAEWKEKRKAE